MGQNGVLEDFAAVSDADRTASETCGQCVYRCRAIKCPECRAPRSHLMTDTDISPSKTMTEDEAAEFAEQVFDVARQGNAVMLERLLEKGLPADLRNHKGDTLLMLASYHCHADAVRVLLSFRADPEIRNDNGQSPIAGAAFKGDLAVVRLLVEAGANVDGASADGRTALMMAAMFNRNEIVDYLISQGADPHAIDAKGINALGAAQAMGATVTIEQLTKLGVQPARS
ncbi:Ankyrin [Pseudomonas syringae pv. helianthi]|nr:Ankyrin [Pseudomonas syringae pv. helianthi]